MTGQDVGQEIEEWAEWVTLASAAHSADFYVSCVTSYPATQYTLEDKEETSRFSIILANLRFRNLTKYEDFSMVMNDRTIPPNNAGPCWAFSSIR